LKTLLELSLLAGREFSVVSVLAEESAEGGQIAEQCSGRVDIMDQAPELAQSVLDRGIGQQQDRCTAGA
jgi:hypothetical protein